MWLEIQFEMMWLGAIQESINANSELRKQFLVVGNACILVVVVFHVEVNSSFANEYAVQSLVVETRLIVFGVTCIRQD
jgi:hypothetical protein